MVDLSTARRQQTVASSSLIRQLPPASRFILRGASDVLAAAADTLRLPRNETACRAVHSDILAMLWLGPDERLLIGPADGAEEMNTLLQRTLAGMPHSLVETSHAQMAFELSGAQAAAALNIGCPLDLDPASFPVDMCTRTVFAKAQIVLWRMDPERFRAEVARSFAPYVTKVLALADREPMADSHYEDMRTVFEAAGGDDGLRRLARAWHDRVMADEVVSHAFSHGFHPQHVERLAAYWAEALGGPPTYSEAYGDETTVVRMHSGNGEHEEMDRRAIACFDQALIDVGLAKDTRLRQVLHDYFAWATTTTMARYHHSADDVPGGLSIPQWSWDGLRT